MTIDNTFWPQNGRWIGKIYIPRPEIVFSHTQPGVYYLYRYGKTNMSLFTYRPADLPQSGWDEV